jgi:protease IV
MHMLRRSPFVPLALFVWVGCLTLTTAAAEEKKTATVAHIRLSGALDEAPVATDPLFGVSPENFKTKLDRIRKAAKDKSVEALYLQLDGLQVGWGKLDELAGAVAEVRKAGKKVFAYLESGDTKDYLLGLACDQVYIPESGWLMLTGVRAEVTFYKELLDKLGVKADMLQMGAYKGAAEPFTRTKLSPETRQQLGSVINDYYEKGLVERIVAGRKNQKWSAAQVKKLIDRGPYTARQAVKEKLVDGLAYTDGIENALERLLAADKVTVTRDYGKKKADELDLSNPFAIFKLLKPATPKLSKSPKVAVIYAVGTIATGKGGKGLLSGNVVGSKTMVEAIRKAEKDSSVKAIVLRVDSPGGSALASDLIWHELRKSKKPVIASMSDVAASGGYYISMGARKVYAEPGTLTGSIGVVGGKLALGGLYDKVGINTEVIKRGANADILSPDRAFSPSERAKFKEMMEDIYDQFLTKVLEGRKRAGKKMTRDDLEKLAGGRIWTGRQAKENGLVDELGTLRDAIADAWKQAKMPATIEPELLILPKPKGLIETLVESLEEVKAPAISMSQMAGLRELTEKLGPAAALLQLRNEPVWAIMPYGIKVK